MRDFEENPIEREDTARPESAATEPLAIVGMGCRFPGGVETPEDFWTLMAEGRDGIVEIPADRLDLQKFYDARPEAPGKIYVRHGGFLNQPIDAFDAEYFGMSPREAAYLDPQQRLLLEVAHEALEDAGIPTETIAGSNTGVFIGGFMVDGMLTQFSPLGRHQIGQHTAVSSTLTILSNRLSYLLDLHGPSFTLDTACSSSLVAMHQACQAIRGGECDLALIGGVNVIFRPETLIAMCKGGFLSRDGRSKSFDARADGYGRGEGAGVVVVKRLSAALADGDRIHAVIRGSGVNQDGRTDGITVPNGEAQADLIRQVLDRNDCAPETVTYVEAHGTGTAVGDPIELKALASVFGVPDQPRLVGSVKANIGHLEAAAGIAAVIKTALCLHRGQVPPVANLDQVNPALQLDDWGLSLPRELQPFPASADGQPGLAAINSFGYGGTNAHVILERAAETDLLNETTHDRAQLLVLSARSADALKALADASIARLDGMCAQDFTDYCFSAAARRSAYEHRLAVVATDAEAAQTSLRNFLEGRADPDLIAGQTNRKDAAPAFVFTGMGPQWWAMGRELYQQEPIFRDFADRVDAVFTDLAGWSVLEEMLKPEAESIVTRTHVAQPANFIVQGGLFHLLQSWGVEPGALVGHSVGEVSSAYAAGVLSLEDAVRVSWLRSKLQATTAGEGGMLAVGLGALDVLPYLSGREDLVSIGADNGPRTITLAGDVDALAEIADELTEDGVFNRKLQVETAYHSPIMDPLLAPLEEGLRDLQPQAPTIPLYSTVSSLPVEGDDYDGAYWCRNVRDSVRFSETVQELVNDGFECFLEVGPHPVLSSALRECLADANVDGVLAATLRREQSEVTQILRGIANLHVQGVRIDWQRFYADRPHRFVALPSYPWQRRQLWNESAIARDDRLGRPDEARLLGRRMAVPQPLWRSEFNRNRLAYVMEHQVEDSVVMPGAAYCEIALQLAEELGDDTALHLTNLRFDQALIAAEGDEIAMMTRFDPDTRIFSIHSTATIEAESWTRHAEGRISQIEAGETPRFDMAALAKRCDQPMTPAAHYDAMTARGLQYGPAFQSVTSIATSVEGEVLAQITAQGVDVSEAILHPTLLDGCFQALISALPVEGKPAAYVPTRIKDFTVHQRPGAAFACYGKVTAREGVTMTADLWLLADDGSVLAELRGITARRLGAEDRGLPTGIDANALMVRFECVEQALADAGERRNPAPLSPIAILSGGTELGGALAEALEAQGLDVSLIAHDAFAADGFRQIVDLRGLEALAADPTGQKRAEASLGLLHAIPQDGVTRCLTVVARHDPEAPQSATLGNAAQFGLLRVAANEYADLDLRMIQIGDEALPALLAEIMAQGDEDDIVLTDDTRLVRRLNRVDSAALAAEASARRPGGPIAEAQAEVEILAATGEAPVDVLGLVTSGPLSGKRILTRLPADTTPHRFVRLPQAGLLELPNVAMEDEAQLGLLPLSLAHSILKLADLQPGAKLGLLITDPRMAGALASVGEIIGAGVSIVTSRHDIPAEGFDMICVDAMTELTELLLEHLIDFGTAVHIGRPSGQLHAPAKNRRDLFIAALDLLNRAPARLCQSLEEVIAAVQARELTIGGKPELRRFAEGQGEVAKAAAISASVAAPQIDGTGAYLVTGGFGGFGFEIAKWLARNGAGHVILAGRKGIDTEGAQDMIAELRRLGASTTAMAMDVGDEGSVATGMRLIAGLDQPLRGVIHAAGVLDDAPVYLLTPEQLDRVMKPKALGAWNLHQATKDLPLDCFVVISSIAALLGSPGQGAYVAANSFLDALVQHRRRQGLPGIGINLGALAEVGMAAKHEGVEKHFARVGVGSLRPDEAIGMLGYILRENPVNMAAASMDYALWGDTYAKWAASPRYRHLMPERAEDGGEGAGLSLAALSPEERLQKVTATLSELVASILRLPADGVDTGKSLLAMGVDSLMAMELQLGIDRQLGLKIPTLELMKGVALRALCTTIAERLAGDPTDAPQPQAAPAPEPRKQDIGELLSRLDTLSAEEIEQAMAEFGTLEGSN